MDILTVEKSFMGWYMIQVKGDDGLKYITFTRSRPADKDVPALFASKRQVWNPLDPPKP